MSALRWAAAGIAAAAVVGCGGGGLDRARMAEPAGSPFDKGLYAGYLELAKSEFAEGDYADADVFARRALAVASGKPPAPESIAWRLLPKKNVRELSDARWRLTGALARNAAAKAPESASRAQVMFDCWMQEQEENHQPDDIARCRTEFLAAMAEIETVVGPEMAEPAPRKVRRQFVVYFRLDSAALTSTARQGIATAAAEAKRIGARRVHVSGFADRAGTNRHNMGLSEERARMVAAALTEAGVSSRVVSTGAFGEAILAVETKDGVYMPANRRVTIDVSN